MKYDNIFLKDLMAEGKSILKEQEALDVRKKALKQQKQDYIKDYFDKRGVTDLRNFPISHNTFISYPEFFIRENDQGKISWIARGKRITIKDGRATHGYAEEEFWQGQWEALPEGIQKLTVEQAKENSKSIFPISPANFGGVSFAAPAYVLYENEDGLQLVWRKAGTAYVDRMSGSATASSGFQILYAKEFTNFRNRGEEIQKAWNKISDGYHKATGKTFKYVTTHIDLTEGGRLSVGLLEKEASKIDLIFGIGVTEEIIEKLKSHQANKTKNKRVLKGVEAEGNIKVDDDPLKHPNVQPGKLKL